MKHPTTWMIAPRNALRRVPTRFTVKEQSKLNDWNKQLRKYRSHR